MQYLSIKVSKEFFNRYQYSKLSPIRITPVDGYHYKHHFVVVNADPNALTFYGMSGSAMDKEISGQVTISYDGDHEEIATVIG
jgi:hypothetical protein